MKIKFEGRLEEKIFCDLYVSKGMNGSGKRSIRQTPRSILFERATEKELLHFCSYRECLYKKGLTA